MVNRRWIRKFSSKFAAKRYLKWEVILSELIVISKTKRQLHKGKIISNLKKRLILNLKKSGVTAVAVKGERPELPRVLDVIFANLEMLRRRRQRLGKGLRHVILDFSNAFFQFPARADERRLFATRMGKSMFGVAANCPGLPWSPFDLWQGARVGDAACCSDCINGCHDGVLLCRRPAINL